MTSNTSYALVAVCLSLLTVVSFSVEVFGQTTIPTDSAGNKKDIFYQYFMMSKNCGKNDEVIYAVGSSFAANINLDIYLTQYPNNGNLGGEFDGSIPGYLVTNFPLYDASSDGFTVGVYTNNFGAFGPVIIDEHPAPGLYNIVAHVFDGTDVFDTGYDAIDQLDDYGLLVLPCVTLEMMKLDLKQDDAPTRNIESGKSADIVGENLDGSNPDKIQTVHATSNTIIQTMGATIKNLEDKSAFSKTVQITSDGVFDRTVTWENPIPGKYNIILDVDNNGKYNPKKDIIDYPDEIGFIVHDSKDNKLQNIKGETHGNFGASTTVGDFNGDGYDDLAVGVPGYGDQRGLVYIMYDFLGEFYTVGDYQLLQPPSSNHVKMHFGTSLTSGNFNNDDYDDLAVGAPYDGVHKLKAGAVYVYYGGNSNDRGGLGHIGDRLTLDADPNNHMAKSGDHFGLSLAAGNFNGDKWDDLAIGAPYKDVKDKSNAGKVGVMYGGDIHNHNKLGNIIEMWSQASPNIEGRAQEDDGFGRSLAAGDFNGDTYDDLAIGVTGEDVDGIDNAGAVNIIYGAHNRLSDKDNQIWHQDSDDIKGTAQAHDKFGWSLVTGDFDGNDSDDLAIGVPLEDVRDNNKTERYDAGAVNIIYGYYDDGLTATNNQVWSQKGGNMKGAVEKDDRFGWNLTVGDYNGDTYDDLAIGVPLENIGGIKNAGAVNIIYSDGFIVSDGLTFENNQIWYQDTPGIYGTSQESDKFGKFLTSGDFNNDGVSDLVVSGPGETKHKKSGVGEISIIHGHSDTHLFFGGLVAEHNHLFYPNK